MANFGTQNLMEMTLRTLSLIMAVAMNGGIRKGNQEYQNENSNRASQGIHFAVL